MTPNEINQAQTFTSHIHRLIMAKAERVVRECPECGGYGYGCDNIDLSCQGCIGTDAKMCLDYKPCPHCTPIADKLRELAEEYKHQSECPDLYTYENGVRLSNLLHADNIYSHVLDGTACYKGAPVKLIPGEGE